jgi:hypothetical protein
VSRNVLRPTSGESRAAFHPMRLARNFGECRFALRLKIPTGATGLVRESTFIDGRYAAFCRSRSKSSIGPNNTSSQLVVLVENVHVFLRWMQRVRP